MALADLNHLTAEKVGRTVCYSNNIEQLHVSDIKYATLVDVSLNQQLLWLSEKKVGQAHFVNKL